MSTAIDRISVNLSGSKTRDEWMLKKRGSFEYKFLIINIDADTAEKTNIFEGQYTVSVYKVISNNNE